MSDNCDSDADGYNSETEEPHSKRPKKEFVEQHVIRRNLTKSGQKYIHSFRKVVMSTNLS